MHIQEQHVHWPWWQCNGGNAAAGGRPCAGCSAVCAGSSPSTEGERPSAGTRRPRSPCWPEPSWTAVTLAPSHRSPSPTETRTERSQKVQYTDLLRDKFKHKFEDLLLILKMILFDWTKQAVWRCHEKGLWDFLTFRRHRDESINQKVMRRWNDKENAPASVAAPAPTSGSNKSLHWNQ